MLFSLSRFDGFIGTAAESAPFTALTLEEDGRDKSNEGWIYEEQLQSKPKISTAMLGFQSSPDCIFAPSDLTTVSAAILPPITTCPAFPATQINSAGIHLEKLQYQI